MEIIKVEPKVLVMGKTLEEHLVPRIGQLAQEKKIRLTNQEKIQRHITHEQLSMDSRVGK